VVARAAAQREADIAAGRAQLTGEPWNEEVSRTWGQFVHVVTACMKDSRGTYKTRQRALTSRLMQAANCTRGTRRYLRTIDSPCHKRHQSAAVGMDSSRGHKHKNSFLGNEDLPGFPDGGAAVPAAAAARSFAGGAAEPQQEDTLVTAPTFLSPSRHSLSRKRSGSLLNANE